MTSAALYFCPMRPPTNRISRMPSVTSRRNSAWTPISRRSVPVMGRGRGNAFIRRRERRGGAGYQRGGKGENTIVRGGGAPKTHTQVDLLGDATAPPIPPPLHQVHIDDRRRGYAPRNIAEHFV